MISVGEFGIGIYVRVFLWEKVTERVTHRKTVSPYSIYPTDGYDHEAFYAFLGYMIRFKSASLKNVFGSGCEFFI
jgi:hypothetical protein